MRQYYWLVHASTLTLTTIVGLTRNVWQTVSLGNSVFLQTVRCIFWARTQLRALSELSLSPAFQSCLSPSSPPLYIITTTGKIIIIMQLKLCLIACSICHSHHFHQNPPKTSLSPPPSSSSSSSSLSTPSNW